MCLDSFKYFWVFYVPWISKLISILTRSFNLLNSFWGIGRLSKRSAVYITWELLYLSQSYYLGTSWSPREQEIAHILRRFNEVLFRGFRLSLGNWILERRIVQVSRLCLVRCHSSNQAFGENSDIVSNQWDFFLCISTPLLPLCTGESWGFWRSENLKSSMPTAVHNKQIDLPKVGCSIMKLELNRSGIGPKSWFKSISSEAGLIAGSPVYSSE